jgi:hypothetical protein
VPHLVDAFNVMHQDPRLQRLLTREGPGPAGRALAALAGAWVQARGKAGRHRAPAREEVILVFDGLRPHDAPREAAPPGVVTVWAGRADDELARRLRPGAGLVLVSADGELVAAAGEAGCEVVRPKRWLTELRELLGDAAEAAAEQRERHRAPPPSEVAAWARLFREAGAQDAPSAKASRPAPRPTPAKPAPKQPAQPAPAKKGSSARTPRARSGRSKRPPPVADRERRLSEDEVQRWKEWFEGAPEGP